MTTRYIVASNAPPSSAINLNETPGNSDSSWQQQQQQQPQQQTFQDTPYHIEEGYSYQIQSQSNQPIPQGLPNSRCVDCDRPVDINFRENGQPPNRCVNCFEEYLADNF